MNALFKMIDNMPIVRMLQIGAIIYLAASLIYYCTHFAFVTYDFTISKNHVLDEYFNKALSMVFNTGLGVGRLLVDVLVMFGLAEIIKLMKEKREK